MEHAKGVQLHQKWPAMSSEQQIACTAAIVRNMDQMAAIDFHAYGCLCFDNVDIDSAQKHICNSRGYVIGPYCGSTYWNCEAREPQYYSSTSPNRGPCNHPYLISVLYWTRLTCKLRQHVAPCPLTSGFLVCHLRKPS